MSGQQWGPPGQYPPPQGQPPQQWGPPGGQNPQQPPQYGSAGQQPYGGAPGQPQHGPAGQQPYGQQPQYRSPGQQPAYGPPGQPSYGPPQQWGPPSGQQQFGWGPMPTPPKKRRGAGVVVLAVVGGLAVLAAVVIGVGFSLAGKADSSATPPVAQPTYEPTADEPEVPTATNEPPTTRPTRPTVTRPTATKPTQKPPPRLTPYQIAATNKLYRTGTQASVGCRESRAGLGNQAASLAYYRSMRACMDRAWRRQVTAAGYQFRPPGLISIATNGSSPCGTAVQALAFYCPTNHTMYMKADLDIQYWRQSQTFSRAVGSHAAAHEYGHAVQELTGILRAQRRMAYDAPTRAAALETERRLELQASCFGNLFLGANKNSYPIRGALRTQWLYVVNNTGDRADTGARDHGSTRNHGAWSRRAFDRPNLALCNTFTAPSSSVS
ncbi:neutral zinc metallopeptidase [Kribbella sp. NPDC051770]|uniref:neutral zinc metallopeptidase n=1 Tax=Kribbella sp. NPDC051770 TaxID=3155413 RepID=UPI0034347DA6